MKPKVVTVILNWNGKDDTLACLASLQKTDYPNHTIVVVDNHSSDDSALAIRDKFPHIHLIVNDKNLGFSGGNNVGIKWALDQQADYCFLLNNDTLVESHTISQLILTLEENKSAGAAGPLILYMEPKETIAALGGTIRWSRAEAIQGYNMTPAREAPTKPFGTDFLTAAAILVKKDVLIKAGLLPENYFYGMEDAAWCQHIKQAGFSLIADPRAQIVHKESASTGHTSPLKIYYTSRNVLLFLRQESHHFIKDLLTYHVKVFKQTAKMILTGQWPQLKAFWQGYVAFWRGETGQKT